MHYYHLEHECSLCFVKGYLIPLVLVSRLCFVFIYFFKNDTVETRMQKCPRCVKFLTRVRHLNEVFVLPRYLVVDVCELFIVPPTRFPSFSSNWDLNFPAPHAFLAISVYSMICFILYGFITSKHDSYNL